jgi:hypothetical protein
MNAKYLELEGFGRYAETAEDPQAITQFLEAIPECEAKLAAYAQDGNTLLFSALEGFLDRAAAGVL